MYFLKDANTFLCRLKHIKNRIVAIQELIENNDCLILRISEIIFISFPYN